MTDVPQVLARELHLDCRDGWRRAVSGNSCICRAAKPERTSMQFSKFVLRFAVGCGLACAALPGATSHSRRLVLTAAPGSNDPWTAADLAQPADLAREI